MDSLTDPFTATEDRYLRLSEVLDLLDFASWYDDARSLGNLGVDEVSGARWFESWLRQKVAAMDWLVLEPQPRYCYRHLQGCPPECESR